MKNIKYYILILIGLLQIIGLSLSAPSLKGLGLATVASPLPLVFSHFRGGETFAADFYLELHKDHEIIFSTQITPKKYSQFKGPYNRRNIYGAIFAYGPYLNQPAEKEMVHTVLRRGFCQPGYLRQELKLPEDFNRVVILVKTKTKNQEDELRFGVRCQ